MRIENPAATSAQNVGVSAKGSQDTTTVSRASAPPFNASNALTSAQSTSVSLSGKAIMLSRLFHTSDPSAAPPVMSAANGLTRESLASSPVYYLTESDRALVSDMYAYVQQQGADPQYVDTLAVTLGQYRQFNNGQLLGGFNGNQFDAEGHQLTSSYSATDTAIAGRILNGDAIGSTRLDHGFLSYILNPTNALSNASNMGFMEQMVVKFSDKGAENMSLAPKFATYSGNGNAAHNVVITASKEVVYKAPETQIANVDGQWFVLDPTVMDDSGLSPAQKANAKQNQALVDTLLSSQTTSKGTLLSRLLNMLGLGEIAKRNNLSSGSNR